MKFGNGVLGVAVVLGLASASVWGQATDCSGPGAKCPTVFPGGCGSESANGYASLSDASI